MSNLEFQFAPDGTATLTERPTTPENPATTVIPGHEPRRPNPLCSCSSCSYQRGKAAEEAWRRDARYVDPWSPRPRRSSLPYLALAAGMLLSMGMAAFAFGYTLGMARLLDQGAILVLG